MTTAPPPPPCRCGADRDHRGGLCTHCDAPPPISRYVSTGEGKVAIHECPTGCVACRTRDAHCEVCRTDCGTPVAAAYHQRQCRKAETFLRNNPA